MSAAQANKALRRLEAAGPVEVYFQNKVDALDTEKATLTRRFCERSPVVVRFAFSEQARRDVLAMAQERGFFDVARGRPNVPDQSCGVHPGTFRHLRIKTLARDNEIEWASEWCLPSEILKLEPLAERIESEIANSLSLRNLPHTDCVFR